MSLTRSKNGFSPSVSSPAAFSSRQGLAQLFEQVLLFLGELLRHRDAGDDVEVAVAAAGHVRHALAAHLEARARLACPAGTCSSSLPSSVGTLIVPPSASVGNDTGISQIEVVLLAMEERVLLHVHDDVEIAGRAAGGAVLALAVEPQALTGRDAGGNLDRQLALAADAAGAAAALARLGDGLARAAAVRAGPRDGEESLLVAQLAGALALRAGLGVRAGRGAGALAGLAGLLARDLDRGLGAGGGLLEGDLEVVAQVGAALRPAAPPPAAEDVAEPEDVAEARRRCRAKSAKMVGSKPAPAAGAAHALVAEPVVERALLLVGEHRVGLGRFLEALFGGVVAGVLVGVILDRELAVRAS